MARQRIAIGAEIDAATVAEIMPGFEQIGEAIREYARPIPTIVRYETTWNTGAGTTLLPSSNATGAGGGTNEVLAVPPGRAMDIHRVSLWSPGAAPNAPIVAGWIALERDGGDLSDGLFWPQPAAVGGVVVPVVVNYGDGAPRMQGGERLLMASAGLANNLEVIVLITARLWGTPQSRDKTPAAMARR